MRREVRRVARLVPLKVVVAVELRRRELGERHLVRARPGGQRGERGQGLALGAGFINGGFYVWTDRCMDNIVVYETVA